MRISNCRQYNPIRQRGFALLELALALVLISMLAGKVLFDDYEKLQTLKLEAQAKSLKTLQSAHNNFLVTYYDKLANGVPITGSDDLNVTVAQLVALNIGLPPGFSDKAIIGGRYKTTIVRTPSNCPGGICQMEGLVWIDTPYLKNGKANSPALGVITRAIGPDAAYSSFEAPSLLEGLNWSTANPEGARVGIVGVRTGYNSSGMAQFLRRDGSLPMTGALNMNGQHINAVNGITAQTIAAIGPVSAGSVSTTGTVSAAGRIRTGEYLEVGGTATAGNICVTNGTIAKSTTGALLSCEAGFWKKSGSDGGLNSGLPGTACVPKVYCGRNSGTLWAMPSTNPACVGGAGTPIALFPWNVTWNGSEYIGTNNAFGAAPAGYWGTCRMGSLGTWAN